MNHLAFTLLLLASLPAAGTPQPSAGAQEKSKVQRSVVVISDLHMGLGRDAAGVWHPTEDFRWPAALEAFLAAIAAENENGLDLVIAGDFLELWQRPASIPCAGPRAASAAAGGKGEDDYGCTVNELLAITKAVLDAHRRELAALARFAAGAGNCLIVVPGNHDAALVLDPAWQLLEKDLGAARGCVRRVVDGIWSSADGRVVVEHGHQIGWDANKYQQWPQITRRFGGEDYIRQPWGENFVQRIYNAEEGEYPLIDNLSPSSAGVRYRMADRGLTGSVQDVARFVRFNLFDTSLRQKIQILTDEEGEGEEETPAGAGGGLEWDLTQARALGHRLFLGAFDPEDPFARALASGGEEWKEVRDELERLARTLPKEEVSSLCDQLALRSTAESCEPATLGLAASKVLLSRERILRDHLTNRAETSKRMKVFVYGHTHSFELPWELIADPVTSFRVANSGAFQRLVDDEQLRSLAAAAELKPAEYLRRNTPEDLPACYTSVHLPAGGELEVRAWYMPEDAPSGRFVDPCADPCPRVGHGCEG